MQKKNVKRLSIAGLLLAVMTAVGPCAITHKFGPYYGIVLDLETSEPIEGAVVLVYFVTKLMTLAGDVHQFVDSQETMTDKNGEFHIESDRVFTFRFLNSWDKDCSVKIFKPGYGVYHDYPGIVRIYSPWYSIPSSKYITIKLHRLHTFEERHNNLYYILPGLVPNDKQTQLHNQERADGRELGLK